MKIESGSLSTNGVSKLTGLGPKTIEKYCRIGELGSAQMIDGGKYFIPLDDLCLFMYKRPTTVLYLEQHEFTGIFAIAKTKILEYVSQKPKLYNADSVADIFEVTRQTIWNWIHSGKLVPCYYEITSNRRPVFSESSLKRLVHIDPRLRKFYTAYNEKRKVS